MTADIVVLLLDGTPDSQGETFRKEGLELPVEEVPVILEFRMGDLAAYVGRAKLRLDGDRVVARMTLLPRMGENSALGTLYPSIGGVCHEKKDKVIWKCAIQNIGLSISKNADDRIPTLLQQGMRPQVQPVKVQA